jgi:hypothetical protein
MQTDADFADLLSYIVPLLFFTGEQVLTFLKAKITDLSPSVLRQLKWDVVAELRRRQAEVAAKVGRTMQWPGKRTSPQVAEVNLVSDNGCKFECRRRLPAETSDVLRDKTVCSTHVPVGPSRVRRRWHCQPRPLSNHTHFKGQILKCK